MLVFLSNSPSVDRFVGNCRPVVGKKDVACSEAINGLTVWLTEPNGWTHFDLLDGELVVVTGGEVDPPLVESWWCLFGAITLISATSKFSGNWTNLYTNFWPLTFLIMFWNFGIEVECVYMLTKNLIVVVSQRAAKFVIVHIGLVLSHAPQLRHLLRLVQLELAILRGPWDKWRWVLIIHKQLEQKLPQCNVNIETYKYDWLEREDGLCSGIMHLKLRVFCFLVHTDDGCDKQLT